MDLKLSKIRLADGLHRERRGALDFVHGTAEVSVDTEKHAISSFTLLMYIKFTGSQSIFRIEDTQGNRLGFNIRRLVSNSQLKSFFPKDNQESIETYVPDSLNTSQWNLVAITFDRNSKHLELIRSGETVIKDFVGAGNFTNVSRILLGQAKFDGMMTCVQFYSKALSVKEFQKTWMELNNSCPVEKFGANRNVSRGKLGAQHTSLNFTY